MRYSRAENPEFQDQNNLAHVPRHGALSENHTYEPRPRYEPFPFEVNESNKDDIAKRVVVPLCDMPYEEQLALKESHCRSILRSLGKRLSENGTPIRLNANRLPCHVESTVPATKLTKFRNHTNFDIWHGYDKRTPTVGYFVFPIAKHGNTICVEPNSCTHLNDTIIEGADVLQDFIRTQARLSTSFSLRSGGWKRFKVRTNYNNQLMVVGTINSTGLQDQQLFDEIDNFRDFVVSECDMREIKLASLYYEENRRKGYPPLRLIHGTPDFEDRVGNYKFIARPTSNSNVNTEADCILFNGLRKTINQCYSFNERKTNPLIFIDNCGSGLLALNISDMAQQVIGLDDRLNVIDNARMNARLNNINNVEFIRSDLSLVIGRTPPGNPRNHREKLVVCHAKDAGLDAGTMELLRNCGDLDKFIYISPNVGVALDNLVQICSRTWNKDLQPLVPVLATPVDTDPHTRRYKMIIALERQRL